MICSRCKESREIGIGFDIVSGFYYVRTILDYSTATHRYHSSESTWTGFKDLSLWICQDCWQLLIKKKLDRTRKEVVKGAIPIGVVILLYILGSIFIFSQAMAGWNCIAGVPFIILGIMEAVKINTWNRTKKKATLGMLECVTENNAIDELAGLFLPIVSESRKADAVEGHTDSIEVWEAKAFYVWQHGTGDKEKTKPSQCTIHLTKGVPDRYTGRDYSDIHDIL